MEFKVELRPHQGIDNTARGPIPVRHAQDMVWLNGVHVGFVGHQEGAPVNTLVRFDPHTAERLRQEVAKLRGTPVAERTRQPVSAEDLRDAMHYKRRVEEGDFDDEDFADDAD